MRDLRDGDTLRRALRAAQERKREQLREELGAPSGWADDERRVLEEREVIDRWIGINGKFPLDSIVEDETALRRIFDRPGDVVFEGAQGVLLDEWRGFHPHTTWSTCTFDNALELLRDRDRAVTKLGVVRTYLTRHGAGPMPTEDRSLDALLPELHNSSESLQGRFRRGWFDAVLARYAVEAGEGIDALAITHVDALTKIDRWRMAIAYEGVDRLPLAPKGTLSSALTDLLVRARPILETRDDPIGALEECIGAPRAIVVDGPTASHARFVQLG